MSGIEAASGLKIDPRAAELDPASLDRVVTLDLRIRAAIADFAQQESDLGLVVGTLNRVIADVIASMSCGRCREAILARSRARLPVLIVEELTRRGPDGEKLCNDHAPPAPSAAA